MRFISAAFILGALVPALAACGLEDPLTPSEPSFERFTLTVPPFGPFVDPITPANANPYFPLVPGTEWTYVADAEDGLERTVDTVTDDTRTILGVTATVLKDEVYLCEDYDTPAMCDGNDAWALVELTYDWYAQDQPGNVWYLGEASCEYEPGAFAGIFDPDLPGSCETSGGDPAGSWQAGVDGAEAGIIMWADPLATRGKTYRQEYYAGEAEDMAKVLQGGLTVRVPAGTYRECIRTMDFSPLAPGAREFKYYCEGFGMVLEVSPSGGQTRNELVSFLATL
jgi:hypothetical protein